MEVRRSEGFVACVGIVLCLMLSSAAAQQEPVPTSAVHAGKLIDVRTGRVTTNAYILLAKDRILRIADSAPADIPTIDLSKYTVVPGLIDSHAHVLGNPKDQSSASGLRMSSAQKALCGAYTTFRRGSTMDSPHYEMRARTIWGMGSLRFATASTKD